MTTERWSREDDFLAISQWIFVTCASNWHLQRHIALAKVTERDYESMIMAVVLFILFWLRLVRIEGFSSLTSQSLTLPDIDRKLIMNLHASATIYLLIIDPIEDLQLLILLPRLIAMMSSWSCFLNPLFFTEEWSSCCSWSSFRWYLFAGGKIGIFSSCLNPEHHFNQNGIHRNLVARFNRSAYGSLLFIHHHFKTWLYIVNKWHCNI